MYAVSPVAANQSAMRAVACYWWDSLQSTLAVDLDEFLRNRWKSLVEVADIVGSWSFAGHYKHRWSRQLLQAGGGVVINGSSETTAPHAPSA